MMVRATRVQALRARAATGRKIMDLARIADDDSLLLETLNNMEAARALYKELGFEEIPPRYFNPIEGDHY